MPTPASAILTSTRNGLPNKKEKDMSRYDRYDARGPRGRPAPRGAHSLLGFWVPVAMTTAIAAGGLAAWVIGTRAQHHPSTSESDDEDLSYGEGGADHAARPSGRPRPRPDGPPGAAPGPSGGRDGAAATATGAEVHGQEDAGILGRVAGAIRRTPSPQQIIDGAGRHVAAGVAAAGAVAGAALSAIREDHREDDNDFADHERWRREEQAGARGGRDAPARGARTVAIVVSAVEESGGPEEEKGWKSEQAVSALER